MARWEKVKSPPLTDLFYVGGVQYLEINNLGSMVDGVDGGSQDQRYIFSPNKKEVRVKEIALMPFEGPLFPGSREFLFIYEVR
jgi:hypothetical protein